MDKRRSRPSRGVLQERRGEDRLSRMDDSCDEVVVSGTDGRTDRRTWEGSVKVGFLTSVSAVIIPQNRKPAQDRIVFVFLHPISLLFYSPIIRPNIALLSE